MTFSAALAPTDALVERVERFVTAARALANETGSAAFTVAQVTEGAALSLKSFYRCFPGKDELLLALLADDSRVGAEVLRERLDANRDADPVHTFVRELFALAMLPGAVGYSGVLVREYRRLSEHHADGLRTALAPIVDILTSLLGGEHARRDAETMFTLLLDGIHQLVTGQARDATELGDYLYRFCTQGVTH